MGWEDFVRGAAPYTPGEQPKRADILKLNTNECPYPPSPRVAEALARFDADTLRLYPDPDAGELLDALAAYCHVSRGQVFAGVGSDDVLGMAFLTFFGSPKPILFPDVTYSFYEVWAKLYGIPFRRVPLDGDFRLRPEAYLPEDAANENGGVVFPNPNAPTGIVAPLSAVERIVSGNPDSVVIVDEAYVDFGGQSALPLVDKYENLLVVQTFSKSRSLAGLRVGYAVGSEKLIACLNRVKYSYNSYPLNRLSVACAVASLGDDAYFRETVGKIVSTREWTKGQLRALGYRCLDSGGNFLFASPPGRHAREIFQALRGAGIYVRYFDQPRTGSWLRITVGTDAQMRRLVDFLKGLDVAP